MLRPTLRILDDTATSGPTWEHLARVGDHYPRSGGKPVALSRQDLADAIAGFSAAKAEGWWPIGAPLGVNHAAARGAHSAEETKSFGYVLDLRLSGDDIEAQIDWTEEGRRRVKAREFQALSAEILWPAKSKRTGETMAPAVLTGATLTNDPMVSGLRAVHAAETPAKEPSMQRTAKILNLADGLVPTDDVIAVALSERDSRIATLSEQIRVVTADRDAAKAEVATARKADEERAVSVALAEGRIKDTADERALFVKLSDSERGICFPKGRVTGNAPTLPIGGNAGTSPESEAKRLEALALSESVRTGRPAHAIFAELMRSASN